MTSQLGASPDDFRGAFRRFYVWHDPVDGWHAVPLPKLTPAEISYGVRPELTADTLQQLAFACTWQRSRRNVLRYLQKYGEPGPTTPPRQTGGPAA